MVQDGTRQAALFIGARLAGPRVSVILRDDHDFRVALDLQSREAFDEPQGDRAADPGSMNSQVIACQALQDGR